MHTDELGAAPVSRLQRIGVLLVSRDRRFLRVTAFLLARAGFDVVTAASPTEAYTALDRRKTDVAVVDTSGSLAEAARLLAAVEVLHPRMATVAVAEGIAPDDGTSMLPKWGAAAQLAEAIERAYLRPRDLPGSAADVG